MNIMVTVLIYMKQWKKGKEDASIWWEKSDCWFLVGTDKCFWTFLFQIWCMLLYILCVGAYMMTVFEEFFIKSSTVAACIAKCQADYSFFDDPEAINT